MTDVATRISDAAAGVLGRRLDRRSLLRRAAFAGSTLSVAPLKFALQPGSAYAAICGCANQNCDCGSACCDGYTEFCCTLTGQNGCPPGSTIGGWWKADGSGLCVANGGDGPRYYMDCHAPAAAACGPSGVTSAATNCGCGCAGGSCDNRVNCCNAFRYGQCNQQVPCLGPILCRVVTCVPPWMVDGSCTTAVATDNFTAGHDAPCLHVSADITQVTGSLPAMVSGGWWYRGIDRFDQADRGTMPYTFGEAGDIPVFGDWNGDGSTSPGVVRGNQWILGNGSTPAPAPAPAPAPMPAPDGSDIAYLQQFLRSQGIDAGPIDGDYGPLTRSAVAVWQQRIFPNEPAQWDGSWGPRTTQRTREYLAGVAPPAPVSPNQANGVVASFVFGEPGDTPIVGDWVGDGISRPGVVRGNVWYLRLSHTSGPPDISFAFGEPGDIPVVGDWDGDRIFTPGVVRGNLWIVSNHNQADGPVASFVFGEPGDIPVAGDWNGDGLWSAGVVRNRRQWFVRNSLSAGDPEASWTWDLGPPVNDSARFLAWRAGKQ